MSTWRQEQRRKVQKYKGRTYNITMCGKAIDAQAHHREQERKARSKRYLSELEKIHAAHQAEKSAQRDGHPD